MLAETRCVRWRDRRLPSVAESGAALFVVSQTWFLDAPPRDSSPANSQLARRDALIYPLAARMPRAIGKSKLLAPS